MILNRMIVSAVLDIIPQLVYLLQIFFVTTTLFIFIFICVLFPVYDTDNKISYMLNY